MKTPVLSRWAGQAEGRAGHVGGMVTGVAEGTHWALFLPHVGALQSPGANGLELRDVPRHQEEAGSGPCKEVGGGRGHTQRVFPHHFPSHWGLGPGPAHSEDPGDGVCFLQA